MCMKGVCSSYNVLTLLMYHSFFSMFFMSGSALMVFQGVYEIFLENFPTVQLFWQESSLNLAILSLCGKSWILRKPQLLTMADSFRFLKHQICWRICDDLKQINLNQWMLTWLKVNPLLAICMGQDQTKSSPWLSPVQQGVFSPSVRFVIDIWPIRANAY